MKKYVFFAFFFEPSRGSVSRNLGDFLSRMSNSGNTLREFINPVLLNRCSVRFYSFSSRAICHATSE